MVAPAPDQRNPVPPLDDSLIDVLRAYDDQILAGASVESTLQHGASGALPSELTPLLRCITLLERTYRRRRQEPLPPTTLGRFRIVRVLGQGGFGIVYLATDITLGRHVALKLPRLHTLQQPGLLERFLREARAAAGLDHPHIVPVHEAGETDGLCYIASAYCPGPTLAAWIREHAPQGAAPQLAAEIVARLTDAVEYSHSRGVLHRDIKPGNVLLVPESARNDMPTTGAGPLPTFGFTPRLADFGLAKVIEVAVEHGTMTLTGDVSLGTPSYMAPEQLRGSAIAHGPATDIYALGAVLYELLTGRPPFAGTNIADVLQQVQSAEPVAVRQFRRSIPRDLETICLKCLQKEPRRRYATAGELRDDLQRFLRREPVRARPPGPGELTLKWMRRRPAAAALVAVSVLGTLVLAGVQSWHSITLSRVNAQLGNTNSQLTTALVESQQLQQELVQRESVLKQHAYAAALDRAERDLRNHRMESARELLADFLPRSSTDQDIRGIEWHYLWEQARDVEPVREFADERSIPLLCAALSPDGRFAVTGDDSGRIVVWNAATGKLVRSWQAHDQRVRAVRFSPDSRYLASGGSFHWLHIWDTKTWGCAQSISAHDGTIEAIDFSRDGHRIASGGRDGFVRIWVWREARKNGEVRPLPEISDNVVYQVRYTADGRLVYMTKEGGVGIIDTATMAVDERRLPHSNTSLMGADASSDGQLLAAGGYFESLTLLSMHDDSMLRLPASVAAIRSASVSANGRRVCVTARETIRTYDMSEDLRTCVRERRWTGHPGIIAGSALSADGRWLLSAGAEGAARLWDLEDCSRAVTTRIWLPKGDEGRVEDLAFSPKGSWFAVSGQYRRHGRIGIIDLKRPAWRTLVKVPRVAFASLQFSGNGERLFALVHNHTGKLRIASWNVAEGETNEEFETIYGMADFAPLKTGDPLLIASNGNGGQVGVWDRQNQRMVRLVAQECGTILRIELTPDERWMCIMSEDRPPVLVDFQNGQKAVVEQRSDKVEMIAIHPGGQQVTMMQEEQLSLFDVGRHEVLLSAPVNWDSDVTQAVSISPDGRLMATLAHEVSDPNLRGVTLWDLRSHRSLYTLPTDDLLPWTLSWSPDSRTLAAGLRATTISDGPDVILWHLGASELSAGPAVGD